jgi:hypothetical protein
MCRKLSWIQRKCDVSVAEIKQNDCGGAAQGAYECKNCGMISRYSFEVAVYLVNKTRITKGQMCMRRGIPTRTSCRFRRSMACL